MQLEPASAVWTSGLTVQQSRKLQRVENRAIAAFSDKREDPKISALRLKLEPLDARRQNWPSSLLNKLWREPPCKTKRHLKSALPYLTRLLNGESS